MDLASEPRYRPSRLPRYRAARTRPSGWGISVDECLGLETSGEDDLAAGGPLVELPHRDDVLDLGDEVVLLQTE